MTGLSSSFVLLRLMAECGTKAPGVLKGYIDLQGGGGLVEGLEEIEEI